jgi:hypothetical protein
MPGSDASERRQSAGRVDARSRDRRDAEEGADRRLRDPAARRVGLPRPFTVLPTSPLSRKARTRLQRQYRLGRHAGTRLPRRIAVGVGPEHEWKVWMEHSRAVSAAPWRRSPRCSQAVLAIEVRSVESSAHVVLRWVGSPGRPHVPPPAQPTEQAPTGHTHWLLQVAPWLVPADTDAARLPVLRAALNSAGHHRCRGRRRQNPPGHSEGSEHRAPLLVAAETLDAVAGRRVRRAGSARIAGVAEAA